MADLEKSHGSESDQKKESIFAKIGSFFSGNQEHSDYLASPSRRNFLRAAALVGASQFLGTSSAHEEVLSEIMTKDQTAKETPHSDVEEINSQELEHIRSVPLIIDTFDNGAFYDEVITAQAVARGIDAQSILKKLGVTPDSTYTEVRAIQPTSPEERVILLLTSLKILYGNHGHDVSKVRELTAQFLGETEFQSDHASRNKPSAFDSVEFDDIGNPILWFVSSVDAVDQVVEQSQATLINMSFEIGKVGIKYDLFKEVPAHPDMLRPSRSRVGINGIMTTTYYDGERNVITADEYERLEELFLEKIVVLKEDEFERGLVPQDGYIKERAYQTLGNLANLASKYPDKIFVAAAGNPAGGNLDTFPDLREAKAKLIEENRWPPNVFMVGYVTYTQMKLVPTQYGADFYVYHQDIEHIGGQTPASSFATPMVTEIVRQLQNQGITDPTNIRNALIQFSENINTPDSGIYYRGNQEQPFYMIDFGKVKREFASVDSDRIKAE